MRSVADRGTIRAKGLKHPMKLLGHSIGDLLTMLRDATGRVDCTGLSGAEQAYLVYRLYGELKRPLFVLCASAKKAERLAQDIGFFSAETDPPIITFPSYDILPFKPLSYHPETACQRIEALYPGARVVVARLPKGKRGDKLRLLLAALLQAIGQPPPRESVVNGSKVYRNHRSKSVPLYVKRSLIRGSRLGDRPG